MKRWLTVLTCVAMDIAVMHSAWGQRAPRARTVTVQGSGGYLGVGVAEVDDERAKALKLKEDYGVIVMNVGGDTPAAKAGLKESDVIVEFNGQRVEGVDQFMRLVRETPPNRKVTLRIIRNSAPQAVTAILASRSINTFEIPVPEMPEMPMGSLSMPPMPSIPSLAPLPDTPRAVLSWQQAIIGIEAEPLRGQLAEYFGVKEGVLVRSVARNSPAEKAGIKAGDVVVKVAANSVKTPQELSREVRALRGRKETITLNVVRNRRDMSMTIKPGEGWRSNDDEEEN